MINMKKFKSISKKPDFLKRHKIVITTFTVAMIVFLSFVLYDTITTPPSQVPVYSMNPLNLGGYGFTYNGTTYPHKMNESRSSFAVTFELMHGIPLVLLPGYIEHDGVVISILSDRVISPYSDVTFFVSSANLTIGNYTSNTYELSSSNSNSPLTIGFTIDGTSILQHDHPNLSYTGKFVVTLIPVLHYGMFYFIQNEITLNYTTQHPWIFIDEAKNS